MLAESLQRSKAWQPVPGEGGVQVGEGWEGNEEKHPGLVSITITQIQKREFLKTSLWLALFRLLNFLL